MNYLKKEKTKIQNLISNAFRLNLNKVEFMTDEELMNVPTGSVFFFDVECFVNFFYVAFKCYHNGKFVAFERSPAFDFQEGKLRWMLWRFCIVGFNSNSYDVPMLELALSGLNCGQLKEASDYIIKSGKNYGTKKVTKWDIENKYKIKIGQYNHIDLFNVCPVNGGASASPASLKLYAARMHAPRLQDLPFAESHVLTAEDAEIVRPYCCNDLENTERLYKELLSELKLRVEMSEEYGLDLRSKSDAQIAEAVINKELEKILGYYPKKGNTKEGVLLSYNMPDFISFQTEQLKNVTKIIESVTFELDAMGSPIMPRELEKLEVKMGTSCYKLGMGGLHSQESKISHTADENTIISDNDVKSFYPRIILNQRLFPTHLGEAFLTVYEYIVNRRLDAKEKADALAASDKIAAAGFKVIANTLKIVINGGFGKFGDKYSTLYAPQLMLQVTITGQLVLLMLIEMLELANVSVISGNTDGVVSKYHKSKHEEVRQIIKLWEQKTGFETEETFYTGTYSRDVNAYIAVKKDSEDKEARFLDKRLGVKTKGAFCERGSALDSILSKNPEMLVCSDAVISYLKNGTPLDKTIMGCKDIRRFVSIRTVKGGGHKDGVYLGKVVRWYYPKGEKGFISYMLSGNKVPKTDGARPLMDLPEEFPQDIDYDFYIREAVELLKDCGAIKTPRQRSLF